MSAVKKKSSRDRRPGGSSSNPNRAPPQDRRYTPHSYFSSTIRDVATNGRADILVLFPQTSTELELRKRMFKIYKEEGIRFAKDYEARLRKLVQSETTSVDVKINQWVTKRYIFFKKDLEKGTVNPSNVIPFNEEWIRKLKENKVNKTPTPIMNAAQNMAETPSTVQNQDNTASSTPQLHSAQSNDSSTQSSTPSLAIHEPPVKMEPE